MAHLKEQIRAPNGTSACAVATRTGIMRQQSGEIMRDSKASSSAATVTLARAHLHRLKIIDDPYAEATLSPRLKLTLYALQRWPFSSYGRSATFSFLAARTMFFDESVHEAIREGIRQFLSLGAGFDSRARRLHPTKGPPANPSSST